MGNAVEQQDRIFDVAVIGGGVNGTGIARDAAGRGASVLLLEARDLASGTSSNSSKLIHGGLRYLEHYEFGLVREALGEREKLWAIAPHIIWPMRFVLPLDPEMRFEGGTPVSRMVPFLRGRRPAAMIRAEEAILACDLCLVAGSSLVVYPAAGFPELAKRNGARLVILNREPTDMDQIADLALQDEIGPALSEIIA